MERKKVESMYDGESVFCKVNKSSGFVEFLALKSELSDEEVKNNGWEELGEVVKADLVKVMNGTWLGKPLFDENGIANYKFSKGEAVERTNEEKQEELDARPAHIPSLEEQVKANSAAILTLMRGAYNV